jgi:hypothetical protein
MPSSGSFVSIRLTASFCTVIARPRHELEADHQRIVADIGDAILAPPHGTQPHDPAGDNCPGIAFLILQPIMTHSNPNGN